MLQHLAESLQEDTKQLELGQEETCRLAETLLLDASEEAFSEHQAPFFSTTMATTGCSAASTRSSQDRDDNSSDEERMHNPVENQYVDRNARNRVSEGGHSQVFHEDDQKENAIDGATSLHVDASPHDGANKIESDFQYPQSQENGSKRRNPLSRRVVSMADRSISFSPFITVFDPPDASYYSTDDDISSHQDDDDGSEDSAQYVNDDTIIASTTATVTTTAATMTNTDSQGIEEGDNERAIEVHDTENIQSCDSCSGQCLGEIFDHNGDDKDVIDPIIAHDLQFCDPWSVPSLGEDPEERWPSFDLSGGGGEKVIDLKNVEGRQSTGSANSSEKSLEDDLEEGRLYLDLVREEIHAIESSNSNGFQPLGCDDGSTIYTEKQSKDRFQTNPTPERLLRNDSSKSISENVSKIVHTSNQAMMAELAGVDKKKSIRYSMVFQLGLALGLGLIAAGCAVHFFRQSGWGI